MSATKTRSVTKNVYKKASRLLNPNNLVNIRLTAAPTIASEVAIIYRM